ncbi:unnamed protein product, partial [Amoebophrya sp. A25]|eukprot:GSA25T00013152001.1
MLLCIFQHSRRRATLSLAVVHLVLTSCLFLQHQLVFGENKLLDRITDALQIGQWDRAQEAAQAVHDIKNSKERTAIVQHVQDTVAESKRSADNLLLYLNRQYALPDTLPCAARWAQNGTHALLKVRFSRTWTGPSGHWGRRYSTVGGEGRVEQDLSQMPLDVQCNPSGPSTSTTRASSSS